jgi:hypothetical protein
VPGERHTDEDSEDEEVTDADEGQLDEQVTEALPVRPRLVFDSPFGQDVVRDVSSEDVTIDEDEVPTSRRR